MPEKEPQLYPQPVGSWIRPDLRQSHAPRFRADARVACFRSPALALPVIVVLCMLADLATSFSQSQPATPLLTRAQEVRQLKPDEAQKSLPAQLHGVITYYDPLYNNLFLQDATSGIFVLMNTNLGSGFEAGQRIEVEGVSAEGDFAPIIRATAVRVLGLTSLPAPKGVSFEQLATGNEDSQWVEVRGWVHSAVASDDRQYLTLILDGQRFMVSIRGLSAKEGEALIDARIRVRGVCYTRYNMKRQLRSPWLAASSRADVVVESPSRGEPSEVQLANLSEFNSEGYYGRRLKVGGVVTLQKLDGNFFIQSGDAGLAVLTDETIKLEPGDRVTVCGYIALGQYTPILEDALVRRVDRSTLPAPARVTLKKLLDSPDDFEGVLVRLEANLMNRVEGSIGQTLVLEASNVIFTAHLETPQADERFKALKAGSTVALKGVFIAQPPVRWPPHLTLSREKADPRFYYAPPESVEVLLHSSADVAVLKPPPWWTLARLLWVLGIMSLVLMAGLLWVFVLNNRVRRQTRIIEEKVKREGILEERNRIAREFHDTLEEELAAVTIQLDAVAAEFSRSPEAARRQLELAQNMSRHSHSEARRSVWDMRSHLLENGDLSSALAEMAASLSPASGAKIAVECSGAPRRLAAVAEHHLLRIGQEAVANALKHSGATHVKVALDTPPSRYSSAWVMTAGDSIREQLKGPIPDISACWT